MSSLLNSEAQFVCLFVRYKTGPHVYLNKTVRVEVLKKSAASLIYVSAVVFVWTY